MALERARVITISDGIGPVCMYEMEEHDEINHGLYSEYRIESSRDKLSFACNYVHGVRHGPYEVFGAPSKIDPKWKTYECDRYVNGEKQKKDRT